MVLRPCLDVTSTDKRCSKMTNVVADVTAVPLYYSPSNGEKWLLIPATSILQNDVVPCRDWTIQVTTAPTRGEIRPSNLWPTASLDYRGNGPFTQADSFQYRVSYAICLGTDVHIPLT